MLIRFEVENWISFREPAEFSMIASKERQHGARVPRVKKYPIRILPVTAVYGGNASGKTNLFKALYFVKNMVVRGSAPEGRIPVKPFRLDPECAKAPCRFTIELLEDEMIHEFSFAVTEKAVVEEKLVRITSTSERVLYHRHDGKPHFDPELAKDEFLRFAFQGTRDNQLFLFNSVSQKVDRFKPVHDWFKRRLTLIAPDDRFGFVQGFTKKEHPRFPQMNEMLSQLDTGILNLGSEDFPLEHLPLSDALKARMKEEILEEVPEGSSIYLPGPSGEMFVLIPQDGDIRVKKLITYHQGTGDKKVKFGMDSESDGSRRVIDLLPAFIEMARPDSKKVFVIDAIDRSLHTLLTRQLLEFYLAECAETSRSQLLFTTHDLLLMDQELLRRDEIWVAERNDQGGSELISFSDYKEIRYDTDIRKSYLQGRLGGIPRILDCKTCYHRKQKETL